MKTKTLAITNGIFLLATLTVNFLANWLPIGGRSTGELSDMYANLFVPAWFTFSIWWVIYVLLLCFVIWQLIDTWSKKSLGVTKRIGPWFILSCIANMSWIVARHYTQVGFSVIIMLCLLGILIVLDHKVKTGKQRWTWKNKLFTQIPFGIYLGWISVATIANISTFLVATDWKMWGMSPVFRTVSVIGIATLLWVFALVKKQNIPFVLVLLRAFYGIASKRIAIDPVYASDILWMLALCSIILSRGVWWKREQWMHTVEKK